ncbi:GYF domain-containing protein [uncultured Proteiniphilum sp.]|uniref:GYF domain-containing protein n=1 Tax=uncultured Proteiniphilum sp. TaxID=497637 RepID=UPI00263A0A49|nr:GYF domain-containing protein [uncultured Proteiniphilum sp.]
MNRYFYIDAEGKQKGTFSPEELRREGIKRDTLVWTQGMEQWRRAEEIEELYSLFSDTYREPQVIADQPAVRYDRPGEAAGPQTHRPMPKTWLVESILVTILPFMLCSSVLSLLGIIGIVYAAQVESFYNRGDYAASLESSRSAAKWTRIAMWIAIGWIALIVIGIILFVVFIGSLSGLAGMSDLLNT